MTPFYKGVTVAVLHLAIVLSLGGKLLYDRAHRPRVWVRTGWVDPDLPLRGRYFTLNLQVKAPWFNPKDRGCGNEDVRLTAGNGELVASRTDSPTGATIGCWSWNRSAGAPVTAVFLDQPVAFFIPEHTQMPRLKSGDELWAEVTVPRKGPPRPIQLALKTGAEWHPLGLK
jgi:hypothetical protein